MISFQLFVQHSESNEMIRYQVETAILNIILMHFCSTLNSLIDSIIIIVL